MAHRLAPHAERDLDDIWLYIAKESGSIDTANRVIDTITERFLVFPPGHPNRTSTSSRVH
jgi:plasmid stabilization system protein ParE